MNDVGSAIMDAIILDVVLDLIRRHRTSSMPILVER